MAVTVNSIVDRVQAVLQDTTGVRWPVNNELVLWINDAQREIALLKPDASAVTIRLRSLRAQNNRSLLQETDCCALRNMSSASNGDGKTRYSFGRS